MSGYLVLWFISRLVVHMDKCPLHFVISLYLQHSPALRPHTILI